MAWNISKIPDDVKGEMFKSLATKSYAEVAVDFKIDIHYSDQAAYRNAVYRIANEVRKDPEKYGITEDVLKIVEEAMENRKANPHATKPAEKQDYALIDFTDARAVAIGSRNKVAELLHKKMDMINSNKKELEKISLVQLTTAYGTLFDKAQIMQGQATENISLKARITKDMTPEESLEQLLKMREVSQEELYDK